MIGTSIWLALAAIIVSIVLAKRGRGRRRKFTLRRVRLTPEDPILALNSDIAVKQAMSAVAVSTYRAISLKGVWSISGMTAGEGPLTIGVAHSDYTVAEIGECLQSQASIDPGDKVANEQAQRLVRVIGSFNEDGVLNDGEPVRTKLNWLIAIGRTVDMFAFNESTAQLTTGAVLNFAGDLWVKDSA